MAENWYVRSPDGDRGPFGFPEILGLIRTGSLGGNDDIKCSLEGDWIKAGAIDMHAAEGTGNTEALVKATRTRQRRSTTSTTSRPQPSRLVLIYEEISDRLDRRIVWAVVIIAAWLGINVFVARVLNPYEAEVKYLETFVTIRNELLHHRQADLSEADWSTFSTRSQSEVEQIVAALEKGATAQHPVRRHLLWAGKNCLLPGLKGTQAFTPEMEQRFELYIGQSATALNRSHASWFEGTFLE